MRRGFLTELGAPWALRSAQGRLAGALSGELLRRGRDRVTLRWSGATGPVSVTATDDPTSPLGVGLAITQLTKGRGQRSLTLKTWPRSYVDMIDAKGASVRLGERLLPFTGGRNFRDIGGYETDSGAVTRWGVIFRSGAMTALTDDDRAALRRLGVKYAFDLRSAIESEAEPSPLKGLPGIKYVTHTYEIPLESFRTLVRAPTQAEARAMASEFYLQVAKLLKPYMQELVGVLANDAAPVVINCSAGKDRTGILLALLMSAFGVNRRSVLEDFRLSEVYFPVRKQMMLARRRDAARGAFAEMRALRADATRFGMMTMIRADPRVMAGALDLIDHRYGGPCHYLAKELNVSMEEITRMRAICLMS